MKRLPLVLVALGVIAIALTPAFASNYIVRLATFLCLYATLALSWNFIGGFAGYPSFATAGFFGLGAYAGALVQNAGLPLPLPWISATLIVAAFAALTGFAVLRMRGHYFAIGSIAIVEILRLVASSWSGLTQGGDGLNVAILPGGPNLIGQLFLYTMLTTMLLALAATILVDRGRLGFGLRCIGQNEDAADMVGIDVTRYKIAGFALSAAFCGTVGAIYASWVAYIDPTDAFSIVLSVKVPVMVMLGGAGTVAGPVLGAWAFVLLEEMVWARFLEYNRAMLGLMIVGLVFFLPGGLLNIGRLWPRKRPA